MMAVLMPAAGEEIDFDIAGDRRLGAELENGAAEVGSGLSIPEAGVKNRERTVVEGAQGVPLETLMSPDPLEDALAGRGDRGLIVEERLDKGFETTGTVGIERDHNHLAVAFRRLIEQCQAQEQRGVAGGGLGMGCYDEGIDR